MATYEKSQATGAGARIILGMESDWGVPPVTSGVYKQLNVVGGETLDINQTIYESKVIRSDHLANPPVFGTEKPGGSLPFELAPMGQMQLMYALLGNKVSSSSASGAFLHTFRGQTSGNLLPSFTLEKGFSDLDTATYQSLPGCRINSMTLNCNVDQAVGGTFDIMGRDLATGSASSVLVGSLYDLTSDPFTSVQAAVYEGSSLTLLGTCNQCTLTVNNNLYGENFVLGSNKRANLKFGTRRTTFSGTFLFENYTLYNKALNRTDTQFEILIQNSAGYFFDFLIPSALFIPNNSSPKITTDGPLNITLNGVAKKNTSILSDIQLTTLVPESANQVLGVG